MLCRLADRYWYFEGTCNLHLRGRSHQAVGYSKSLLRVCHTPRNHIPKDCNVITHYHQNFWFQNSLFKKFGSSCISSVHSIPHFLATVHHQVCMLLVHLTCDFSFVIYTPISAKVEMCEIGFCSVVTSQNQCKVLGRAMGCGNSEVGAGDVTCIILVKCAGCVTCLKGWASAGRGQAHCGSSL
jgi:hypothetical protein